MNDLPETTDSIASWEDRDEWNIEPFLTERMGKSVSVSIKRPCVHNLIWLGTRFNIAAFAMVYSQGIDGNLEAVVIPFSAVEHNTNLLDEKSKAELTAFKDKFGES